MPEHRPLQICNKRRNICLLVGPVDEAWSAILPLGLSVSLGRPPVIVSSSALNDSDRRVRCDQEVTAGKNPTNSYVYPRLLSSAARHLIFLITLLLTQCTTMGRKTAKKRQESVDASANNDIPLNTNEITVRLADLLLSSSTCDSPEEATSTSEAIVEEIDLGVTEEDVVSSRIL